MFIETLTDKEHTTLARVEPLQPGIVFYKHAIPPGLNIGNNAFKTF
jgi:hypothetical protein